MPVKSAKSYRWTLFAAGLFGCAYVASHLFSGHPTALPAKDQPENLKAEPTKSDEAALAEGQSLFRGLCSGCHGGAGRGGKGPDLTRKKFTHGSADEDIIRVIKN